jgi:hypothetical protein
LQDLSDVQHDDFSPRAIMQLQQYVERTGQDRTGQDRTGQDRTGQDRTGNAWPATDILIILPLIVILLFSVCLLFDHI